MPDTTVEVSLIIYHLYIYSQLGIMFLFVTPLIAQLLDLTYPSSFVKLVERYVLSTYKQ